VDGDAVFFLETNFVVLFSFYHCEAALTQHV